jgi:membrane fusion protein, multidrug efflux system
MGISRGGVRVMAVILMAGAVAACQGGEASEVSEVAAPAGRVVSVEVSELRTEEFTDFVQVVGTVEANRDVTISAEEAGTIRELLVEKGASVQVGQPIARIDDRVLRAQADQAVAEAALARETWERHRRLWEEDRVGSEINYLQARYRAETAEAGARALRERLERTVVRAPIPGVLDSRFVEVGTLVSPGTPIARVLDTRTVKISGGVPERFAGQITRGSEVEIMLEGGFGAAFRGNITFVGSSVDQSSRTFPVEILVPNATSTLKPGMIAGVRLSREKIGEAIVVPQEAVMRVENGYIVYVVREEGGEPVAEARPVTLGSSQGNRVIVDSGLTVGERVVVVGQNRLATGDRLQIVTRGAGRAP